MRLVAAVMLAVMVLSLVPLASAATSKAKSGCDAGFAHIRATKATKKFDLNNNGWICSQTMRSKGKTTYDRRDDKAM